MPKGFTADGPFAIGAAIGSGTAAVTAERGGADFLLAVNAGRMRNRGAASIVSMLPCHDPTSLTEDFLAKEVLPMVRIPVLLGVNCWGATSSGEEAVARVRSLGAAGAVHFPNATLMSAGMRTILDRAGRGPAHEIETLKVVQDAGLHSLYYCGTREQARMAAEAGLDMILLNFGWNVGGVAGHERRASLEEVALVTHEHARTRSGGLDHPAGRKAVPVPRLVTTPALPTIAAPEITGYRTSPPIPMLKSAPTSTP